MEKQRVYLRLAGEAAQQNFANAAALEYYGQLLPLLSEAAEQFEIHLKRGQVLELMGTWMRLRSTIAPRWRWPGRRRL